MIDLPHLEPGQAADHAPLPAGAQLIFTQARAMERSGAHPAHTTLFWELTGPMDESAMCRAMDTLARTRDYLRLRLRERDGKGIVLPAAPEPVTVETLTPQDLAGQMSAWSTRKASSSQTPDCLLRLIRLGQEHYCIGLSGPHDLLDVWTIDQTPADLAQLYNGALDNRLADLAPVPGFMEFAAWYERLVTSGRLDASRVFWKKLLNGTAPVFTTAPDPADGSRHPMTAVQSALPLDPYLCRAFEGKTRAAGATVFEGYFTLFNLALSRITGKQSLLAAFVVSLRRIPAIEKVAGCLLNRYYIPVRLTDPPDFADAVRQVSQTLGSAKSHALWPVWKEIDPDGTGYPGLFFHYVPPRKGPAPAFKNMSLSPFSSVTPAYWPHPMAFQVMRNTNPPLLAAIGQSGFCSSAWLKDLQQTYAAIMAEVK